MTENKEVILQSRIEQLEAEKAELMEFIKKLCEFAEGFGYIDYVLSQSSDLEQARFNNIIFPLLIHRAVEGWNKKYLDKNQIILYGNILSFSEGILTYNGYQPESLTQSECAMLHCLLDVFKQEERDEEIF